jgi:hypothetical protein
LDFENEISPKIPFNCRWIFVLYSSECVTMAQKVML